MRFGFAISPGLDIIYESDADRATLLAKLEPMRAHGVTWFLLLVDDIPMQPGLAARQAALATWLHDALRPSAVTVCPTEYVGTRPSPYLSDLSAALPASVDLMWTGPTVCSPEIDADDARGWTKAVDGHGVLVWDNYPVNDALMTELSSTSGPYRGRDPDLVDAGFRGAVQSDDPAACVEDRARDRDGLPRRSRRLRPRHVSWARAIADVGGERAASLAVLARGVRRQSALSARRCSISRSGSTRSRTAIDGPDWPDAVGALATELRAGPALGDAFAAGSADDPLAAEVAPWAQAARTEAEAGLAALRLLQQVRPVATIGDAGGSPGRAVGPDPETAMQHAFVVLFLWSAARADEKIVYGPRFVVYTPVIQLGDGSPGLDAAAAVREDANAVDHLCRLALAGYDRLAHDRSRSAGARARRRRGADCGDRRQLRGDGDTVLVRQGPLCTRAAVDRSCPSPMSGWHDMSA